MVDPRWGGDRVAIVVNDEPVTLNTISRLLEGVGFTVHPFEKGEDALFALADGLACDIVVVDLYMPRVDGWRFCRLVRSTDFPGVAGVPILVVSATFAGSDIEAITAETGANAFLAAPFEADELLHFVRELLDGRTPRAPKPVALYTRDPSLSDRHEEALSRKGYQIVRPDSGSSASLPRNTVLVLWDDDLPRSELAPTLEALPEGHRRPTTIALSEGRNAHDRLELLMEGVDQVVPRSVHPHLLLDVAAAAGRERSVLRIEDVLLRRTEALEVAEEQYGRLFQAIPDVVLVLDGDGRIASGNAAASQALQVDQQELPGTPFPDFLCSDVGPVVVRFLADDSQDTGRVTGGLRPREGGDRRSFDLLLRRLSLPSRHVLVVARDVTERLEAEARRRELEGRMLQSQKLESLGLMAGGVAHDFNNLLVGVLGNADLALEELGADHPVHPLLAQIETAARRAADLTGQILAYSGKATRTAEEVDVAQILLELRGLLGPALSKLATVEIDVDPVPLRTVGDPSQLRQVFMNLMMNASEALQGGTGSIRVTAEVQSLPFAGTGHPSWVGAAPDVGEYVVVSVSDTGSGFGKETMDRIFDPFFTTKANGRGLGLAVTLGIVHSHGGGVQVESEEGAGTTFRVVLPHVPSPSAPSPEPELRGRTASPAGRTILVVDDEPTVRLLVTRVLERAGYAVQVAADGREAVECFEAHATEIDAVLLDTVMPVMSGEAALEAIREIDSEVPIVMTSGNFPRGSTPLAEQLGADAVLQKPYRPSELTDLLAALLAGVAEGTPLA